MSFAFRLEHGNVGEVAQRLRRAVAVSPLPLSCFIGRMADRARAERSISALKISPA